MALPWYVDIVNFLVSGLLSPDLTNQRRKKFSMMPSNQINWRCVPDNEIQGILFHCHSTPFGGHFGGMRTAAKILQLGPFPPSWGNSYILLAINYVSKWVEAVALPTNDAKLVLKFLHKNIFTRFCTHRALISDEGSHFDCKLVANALNKYGVKHKIAMAYHP
ncbi:Retrovirus-related Pol polyprotein from transposon 17.6 [Gossypium australe]|uniref:Retrovirus-related Pol polyprotein from transposon 17.6 n=1 Tax=Gossypium australe TaxID=47621 RepID=A0A5B6VN79_9ROSI|nr:Retrovirus-related Pol polyprotein from transposon 17.6 [Gossypium australe]